MVGNGIELQSYFSFYPYNVETVDMSDVCTLLNVDGLLTEGCLDSGRVEHLVDQRDPYLEPL